MITAGTAPAIEKAPADLVFDAETHTYRHHGRVVYGVTSVLKSLHSFAGIPRDVLAAAAARGTAVHVACEYFDQDDLDEESLTDEVATRLDGWKAFCRDKSPKWLAVEARLFHRLHRYAGTVDRFGIIDGELWCIDLKTAASHHPVWGIQTAAYASAACVECRRGTVRLLKDGSYRLDEWRDPHDMAVFVSALNLLNWQASKGLNHDH